MRDDIRKILDDMIARSRSTDQTGTGDSPSTTETTTTQTEETKPSVDGLAKMLEEMLAQYDATSVYTPRTEEERRAQAQDEYQSHYDFLRQTARQQQERSDLALAQQREGLQRTYDQQREESAKNYRNVYSQADRQMLGRGMQRSTYAAQTLANIGQQGAEAQQRLYDAQGAAEANIDAQRAQLAQQLADQLAQYDNSQQTDIMNRMRQLEDQDYTRSQESQASRSQLATSIYNLLMNARKNGISTTVGGTSGTSGSAGTAGSGSGTSGSSGSSIGNLGGSSGPVGSSSWNGAEYRASRAAIEAGLLRQNESPLTTYGVNGSRALYNQILSGAKTIKVPPARTASNPQGPSATGIGSSAQDIIAQLSAQGTGTRQTYSVPVDIGPVTEQVRKITGARK